jgi:hypothetical protein
LFAVILSRHQPITGNNSGRLFQMLFLNKFS